MNHLLRVLKVFWLPAETMYGAAERPAVVLPIAIPSVFAFLTSLTVYFTLPPSDVTLRTAWLVGLISAVLGPALITLIVALLYFGIFSVAGRQGGFKAFLSVTAFAFLPTALHHLAQSVMILMPASEQLLPSQIGRLNVAVFLDPQAVSSETYVAAGMIDVVSIWVLVLLTVGYRLVVSRRLTTWMVAGLVVGPWLLYAGLRIALAELIVF
jgi:hypothetical protein